VDNIGGRGDDELIVAGGQLDRARGRDGVADRSVGRSRDEDAVQRVGGAVAIGGEPRRSGLVSDGDRRAAHPPAREEVDVLTKPVVSRATGRASEILAFLLHVSPPIGRVRRWHEVFSVLFLGLTGLADGLAPKERRYAIGDSPQCNVGPPLLAPAYLGGNSAVVNGGIVATSKFPARSQSYGKRQLTA